MTDRHATSNREAKYRETLVTPDTPLRCDRCGGEMTVAEVEAAPFTCPGGCFMGPRWQTLDGLPYQPKSTQVYP